MHSRSSSQLCSREVWTFAIQFKRTVLAVLAVGCFCLASPARAQFLINVQQVGGNVVATGVGSVDLTGLTVSGVNSGNPASMQTSGSFFDMVVLGSGIDQRWYQGITGPGQFGNFGGVTNASSFTGPGMGFAVGSFFGTGPLLNVPFGYVSGSLLSDSATWNMATLDSLGLIQGTYNYTWGGGGVGQHLTLQIGPGAPVGTVPELADSAALLLLGALPMFCIGYLRRGKQDGTS